MRFIDRSCYSGFLSSPAGIILLAPLFRRDICVVFAPTEFAGAICLTVPVAPLVLLHHVTVSVQPPGLEEPGVASIVFREHWTVVGILSPSNELISAPQFTVTGVVPVGQLATQVVG